MSFGLEIRNSFNRAIVGDSAYPMRLLRTTSAYSANEEDLVGRRLTYSFPRIGIRFPFDSAKTITIVEPSGHDSAFSLIYEDYQGAYRPTPDEWIEWGYEEGTYPSEEQWTEWEETGQWPIYDPYVAVASTGGTNFNVYVYSTAPGENVTAPESSKKYGIAVMDEEGLGMFDSYSPLLEISEIQTKRIESWQWTDLIETDDLLYVASWRRASSIFGLDGGATYYAQIRKHNGRYQARACWYLAPEGIVWQRSAPPWVIQFGAVKKPQ